MRILAISLLAILTASAVYGQSTDSESATISATVIAGLSVSKDQNMAFGEVVQSATSTIAVTDAGAVKFTVGGEANKNVTFTLTSPANLTNGANNLPFTDDVKYHTSDVPGSASDLADGASVALNGTGDLYVYLGGSVTAGAAQTIGAYSGTFTLQVDY